MELVVGEAIPTFTRLAGFAVWNRFAAVNYEFVDIHMDDEAGKRAGYPGAFGMGNLQWAWLHSMLREWLEGSGGRIVEMNCQFRGPSLKDRTVRAKGVITEVRRTSGETEVDLDVWTEDDDGVLLAPGKATVALPTDRLDQR
jgi:acyl dehydratase